ncbi:hypothetical protein HY346_02885 [Candidatus Microgenomates bacterium]|nr:hypothetical protein [Candidatus Microgenomates bacterium]
MAKRKTEPDSVYFLKIVMFFILGAIWLKAQKFDFIPGVNALPVGLLIGLLFARHDHFMIDRKIEYVVLLAGAFLSYIAPIGVVVQL